MLVSISADDQNEGVTLVNAVVDTYFDKFIDAERKLQQEQKEHLDAICRRTTASIREKRMELFTAKGKIPSGDGPTMRRISENDWANARVARANINREIRKLKGEIEVCRSMLEEPTHLEPSLVELNQATQSDPAINRVLIPLLADLGKELATSDEPDETLSKTMLAVERKLMARREQLTEQLREGKKKDTNARIWRISAEKDMQMELLTKAVADEKECEDKFKEISGLVIKIDMRAEELEQLHESRSGLGLESYRLAEELQVPSRVRLLERAEAAKSNEPQTQ